MQRFYMDTCIWRDYFEDRKDRFQPLGEFASRFLFGVQKKGYFLLYSDLIVEELQKAYSDEKISIIFNPFQSNLKKVSIAYEQAAESKQLARTQIESHRQDILHAILARDNGALLVTRDNGFASLSNIVQSAKPEEINLD